MVDVRITDTMTRVPSSTALSIRSRQRACESRRNPECAVNGSLDGPQRYVQLREPFPHRIQAIFGALRGRGALISDTTPFIARIIINARLRLSPPLSSIHILWTMSFILYRMPKLKAPDVLSPNRMKLAAVAFAR